VANDPPTTMLSGMPSGSMNYGIIHAMYYGLIVPSMCWRCLALDAYKGGILCESVLRENCESEVTRRREKEELLPLLPHAAGCVSWELSDPPPCIYCILSLSLNNMDSLPWM